MYARRSQDRELTFDFAEGLIDDNLLMVDRETGSVWSQLAGKAISGELEDRPLEAVPALQATWKFWRQNHPDTRVMIIEDKEGRPYTYFDFVPGKRPRAERPTEHDTSTLGLGLSIAEDAWYFPLSQLARAGEAIAVEIGGKPITIQYRHEGLTAWAEDADGNLLTGVLTYERGWRSFFPETKIFKTDE